MCGVSALLWLWLEPSVRARRFETAAAPGAEAVQEALLYVRTRTHTRAPHHTLAWHAQQGIKRMWLHKQPHRQTQTQTRARKSSH